MRLGFGHKISDRLQRIGNPLELKYWHLLVTPPHNLTPQYYSCVVKLFSEWMEGLQVISNKMLSFVNKKIDL